MSTKYIDGSDLMLFVGNKSIAFATSCKLSINRELTDVSNKDEASGKWGTAENTSIAKRLPEPVVRQAVL